MSHPLIFFRLICHWDLCDSYTLLPHAVNCVSVSDAVCDFFVCVGLWNVSGTAERICAKFTGNWGKTCLVPRLDEFEGQGPFRRGGLHAVYVWKKNIWSSYFCLRNFNSLFMRRSGVWISLCLTACMISQEESSWGTGFAIWASVSPFTFLIPSAKLRTRKIVETKYRFFGVESCGVW